YSVSLRVRVAQYAMCSFSVFVQVVLQYSEFSVCHDVKSGESSSRIVSSRVISFSRTGHSWCHAGCGPWHCAQWVSWLLQSLVSWSSPHLPHALFLVQVLAV